MRWKAIRIVTGVAVSGLALVVAGCGSSKKSSATPTTTTTTTETTTTQSTPTTPTTTTTQSTTPTVALSGKCKDLAEKYAKVAQSAGATNGNIEASAQALQNFVSQVPSEIRGDVQTLADAFTTYAKAIKSAGYTPGKVPTADQVAKLQQAAKQLDLPKIKQAEQNITAWQQKNCSS